jgi:ADP-ribose pyrophosphatase YjhB (NUDIX family)
VRDFTLERLYPNQPFVGVGSVVVCSGKILLENRSNEPGRGKWTVPGGIVELGEETVQATIRETQEETGLIVEKPVLIDVVNDIELDEAQKVKYQFVIIDYFVKLKAGTLKAASDAAELRWVPLQEVESFTLTKTFRQFFIKNHELLKNMESCDNQMNP